jgi:predicted PurR-regulated permease PerM
VYEVKNGKIVIWTILIFLVVLGFVFLWLIREVLILMFISILLSSGIEPVVRWLRAHSPFNRSISILLIYILIFGLLGLLLFLIIPPLVAETQRLGRILINPESARQAISSIEVEFLRNAATTVYEVVAEFVRNFRFDTQYITLGLSIVQIVFSGLTVFVIGFYWSTERSRFKRFVVGLFAVERRADLNTAWQAVEEKLGAWVRGQLIVMLITGVITGIGYSIMGLNFAFPLAVFAALTELIPVIGPYIGGAPAVLVALTQSPVLVIAVVIFIGIFQVVEGNVLVPRVMESAVGISALTVIVGVLIGSALMGITGALLAVPIAATVQVLIMQILPRKNELENPELAP